jgi:branched-chain amino acid transport system permease protein
VSIMADWSRLAGALLAMVAVLFALPSISSYYLLSLATTCVIFATLVVGVDLLHGTLRYLSLAHVGLWGVAAYALMSLRVVAMWGYWPAAGAALVLCPTVALMVAVFSFRATGYYFAILTFVIGELLELAFANGGRITGGTSGLFVFDRPTILAWSLNEPGNFFRFAVVCLASSMLFSRIVTRSSFGWKARAIGGNAKLAAALGMPSYPYRVGMFVASALPTAISGVLYATFSGAIQPELFGPDAAIGTVLMAIIGGTGWVAGPALGAVIYVFLPSVLPFGPVLGAGALGVALILVIRLSPQGVAPRIAQAGRLLGRALLLRFRSQPA